MRTRTIAAVAAADDDDDAEPEINGDDRLRSTGHVCSSGCTGPLQPSPDNH